MVSSDLKKSLEEIRKSVLPLPPLDMYVDEACESAMMLHVSFLFDSIPGNKILVVICRMVGSRKDTWRTLAMHLKLHVHQIKCIQTSLTEECPTFYTLVAFSDRDDATLGRLLKTFQIMELKSLIQETHQSIKTLSDDVIKRSATRDKIIRPVANLVKVPFCLKCVDNLGRPDKGAADFTLETDLRKKLEDVLVELREFDKRNMGKPGHRLEAPAVSEISSVTAAKTEPPCDFTKYVLLTYADDGLKIVSDLVKMFLKRDSKIGVLTLENNSGKVLENYKVVTDWCNKVDYIVPIITKNYLETIFNKDPVHSRFFPNLDHKYAQLIYEWFSLHYVNKSCLNDKIRCLIPDDFVLAEERLSIVDNLFFQAWFLQSKMGLLIDRIIGNPEPEVLCGKDHAEDHCHQDSPGVTTDLSYAEIPPTEIASKKKFWVLKKFGIQKFGIKNIKSNFFVKSNHKKT